MKMCKDHWEQLRADISKYGLDHLIAPDGKTAANLMMKQLEGKDNPVDFDPLMNANNKLWEMALNVRGLDMMYGDKCPACELINYNWIEGAAYQSKLYAEQNGLLFEENKE